MEFVEIDKKDMVASRRRKGEMLKRLEEFIDSEVQTCEVMLQPGEYVTPNRCCGYIQKVIKDNHLPLKATIRQGHIYILRKEI